EKKIFAVSSKGMIPRNKTAVRLLNFNEGASSRGARSGDQEVRGAAKFILIALRSAQKFGHRFASRAGVEFFVDVLKVGLDRRERDLERGGDFLGARALHDLAQNFFLTSGEFFCGGLSRFV